MAKAKMSFEAAIKARKGQYYTIHNFAVLKLKTGQLKEAEELINGERQAHYGEPHENFLVIADMWSAYLGHAVGPGAAVFGF